MIPSIFYFCENSLELIVDHSNNAYLFHMHCGLFFKDGYYNDAQLIEIETLILDGYGYQNIKPSLKDKILNTIVFIDDSDL